MIPQIAKALSHGFTSKQLIDYLQKKFPHLGEKIKTALAAGFSVDQILKFVSGAKRELETSPQATTEYEAMRGTDIANTENRNQNAIAAGTLAATSLGMPIAQSVLQRALPTSLQGLAQQILPGQPSTQSSQPPINVENIQTSSTIPQAMPSGQPEGKIIDPEEYLRGKGVLEKVKDMLKTGNKPEAIAALLGISPTGRKGKIEPEMLQAIEEYSKKPIQEPIQTPSVAEEEIKPITKGESVASPEGMGTVLETRNGQSIIDIDGKKHKVNEDDLIQSPLPEKELADLYDDLISGIHKKTGQQVSRNVEWAGYDPKTNELAYKPHGSDRLYGYDEISPEDVNTLTNLLTKRKSTGENYIGAWEAGTESPIGAAMYQLIKKLQAERGGKGNEYKNRWETIYDALEPAKKAARKRYEERKKKAKKSRAD